MRPVMGSGYGDGGCRRLPPSKKKGRQNYSAAPQNFDSGWRQARPQRRVSKIERGVPTAKRNPPGSNLGTRAVKAVTIRVTIAVKNPNNVRMIVISSAAEARFKQEAA
jgi:hypothetical protein